MGQILHGCAKTTIKRKMTTSPYSNDLREKVIKFLEESNSQRLGSKVFKLSKTTVNTWYVRHKREGSYQARRRLGAKVKIELNKFIEYVEKYPEKAAKDIGKEFKISSSGTRYWLKKLGFSYKKTFTYVEANQETRDKYLELIQGIDKSKLIYVDESGFELGMIKDRGWGKKGKPLKSQKSGKYYKRTNIIAGYVNNQVIAPMVFNGTCNTQ